MYRALIHQQTATMINYPGGGQVGNESYPDYITKGYVPLYDDAWDWNSPHYQSYVSNTMEYSYQDYCAAQYFDALNKKDDLKTYSTHQPDMYAPDVPTESGSKTPTHIMLPDFAKAALGNSPGTFLMM